MDLMSTNVVSIFVVMSQICLEKMHALLPHYRSATQCPVLSYYDATASGKDQCRPCTVCAKGFQMKENCTAARDTVCEPCPPETFNDVSGGTCRKCSICVPGQYTQRHCRRHKNAKCRKCPLFTFTRRLNAGVCRYCKTCTENQIEIIPCRRNRDRKCGSCKTGFFRKSGGGCLQCSPCLPGIHTTKEPACMHHETLDPNQTCWPTEAVENKKPNREAIVFLEVSSVTPTLHATTDNNTPDDFLWRIAVYIVVTCVIFTVLLLLCCFICRRVKFDFLSDPPFVIRT